MTSNRTPSTGAAAGARGNAVPDAVDFRSAVAEDASVQAELQPWVPMECYQLTQSDRVAQLEIIALGRQHLVSERQEAAVQKLGAMPEGLCTLSLSRTASVRFSEVQENDDEMVFFLPEKTEFDVYVPPGVETVYVSFDQAEFLAAARTLDPEGWEHAPRQLAKRHTTHKAALWETVDLWRRAAAGAAGSVPRADILANALFETVFRAATASTPDAAGDVASSAGGRSLRIGRAARALIEDRLDGDRLPNVVDICRELGVSERTLQYAFLDYAGLSPTAYLRRVRLNRVRKTLRRAEAQSTTVTAVAMHFGFLHLGRFSRDYRALFGETPSATLAS